MTDDLNVEDIEEELDDDDVEDEDIDDNTEAPVFPIDDVVKLVGEDLVFNKRPKARTGLYGLYSEIAVYSSVSQALSLELRFLVVDKWLCRYNRKRHRKAGRWVTASFDSYDGAVEEAAKIVKDVAKLTAGEHAPSRFTAAAAFNKLHGELPKDEDWTPSSLKPLTVDYTVSLTAPVDIPF
jgi:hypothetical protein